MKIVVYCISILILILTMGGCDTDEFLTYRPVDEISDNNWWRDLDDFEIFINGAYTEYRHEFASAETWIISGNNLLNDFYTRKYSYLEIVDPTFQWTNYIWEFHYRVVNKMNTVLYKLDALEGEKKIRVEAEAKFLRGYSYLMLHRAYGEIPIRNQAPDASNTASYPKDPVDVVRKQIFNDLTFAVDHLPDTWKDWKSLDYAVGRPLKGSALAYRMLAHMYNEDWNTAIADFETIGSLNHEYGMHDNYRDNFSTANENSKESFFEIQYEGYQDAWGRPAGTHWLDDMTFPKTGIVNLYTRHGGWYLYDISAEFCESFEPGDERRQSCILAHGEEFFFELAPDTSYVFDTSKVANATGYICAKYWTGFDTRFIDEGNGNGSNLNLIQLRYAEVLLNYAECLARTNRINEAYIELNKVRNRAELNPVVGNSLEEFMYDLTLERRHECFAETNVWYDLVRSGMAAKVMKEVYNLDMSPYWIHYPIPQEEINTNSLMVQNDGY